jgi:hypothetical protein
VSDTSVLNSLHLVCRTESGAQPTTPPAPLLLVLPLLLTEQKDDEPDAINKTRPLLFSIGIFL